MLPHPPLTVLGLQQGGVLLGEGAHVEDLALLGPHLWGFGGLMIRGRLGSKVRVAGCRAILQHHRGFGPCTDRATAAHSLSKFGKKYMCCFCVTPSYLDVGLEAGVGVQQLTQHDEGAGLRIGTCMSGARPPGMDACIRSMIWCASALAAASRCFAFKEAGPAVESCAFTHGD